MCYVIINYQFKTSELKNVEKLVKQTVQTLKSCQNRLGMCIFVQSVKLYSQQVVLEDLMWLLKSRLCKDVCQRLDFLVYSDKDDKPYAPSHNPCTYKFCGTLKNPLTVSSRCGGLSLSHEGSDCYGAAVIGAACSCDDPAESWRT